MIPPETAESKPNAPLPTRYFTGAVDVHSHPLPGIDDGAKTLTDSVMMLRFAARYGTVAMIATPHRYWENGENKPDTLRRLTENVRAALAETKFGHRIQIFPGQEIPLTPDTAHELQHGDVLTLADNGRYALVEPPFDHWDNAAAKAIRSIVRAGFVPVLAHPERNKVVQQTPDVLTDLVAAGAKLQLTAMSLTADNGKRALASAYEIIERGWATTIASDSHAPSWRPPNVRNAFYAVESRYGTDTAHRLFVANPAAILRGDDLP